ncbi:MAG: hypothetical protein J6031_06190, partial [Bacteroidales bacterium]|nr:hypothetical protein [Bacteroidales bacterium]
RSDTRYLLFQPFQCPCACRPLQLPFSTPRFFGRKRVQKYNHFPNCQNFFSLFWTFIQIPIVTQRFNKQFFFIFTEKYNSNPLQKDKKQMQKSKKSDKKAQKAQKHKL